MRGKRFILKADKKDTFGRTQVKAGAKGTVASTHVDGAGLVRVNIDGRKYAINDMPVSNLDWINDS